MIIDSLKSKELPLVDGQVRILEVGPGGGQSLEVLRRAINDEMENDGIDKDKIAIDFIPGLDFKDKEHSTAVIPHLLRV